MPDNTARSLGDDLSNPATRPLAEVEQAFRQMELRFTEMAKFVDAAEGIRRTFHQVGQRLVDLTCKAGLDTTHGKSAQEVAVALVTDLADLAAMSVKGSGQLHRALDQARDAVDGLAPVLQSLLGALAETARVVSDLDARTRGTSVQPPSVIVDTRTFDRAASAATRATDDPRRVPGGSVGARGTRFNN